MREVTRGWAVLRTGAFKKSVIFIVVTLLATWMLAATIRNDVGNSGHTYTALFSDVTSLNKGDDVRIAGVRVGTVKSIEVVDERIASVDFTVNRKVRLEEGVTPRLKFRNLVGQRYIALDFPTDEEADGDDADEEEFSTVENDETGSRAADDSLELTSSTSAMLIKPGHTFQLHETQEALDLTLLFNGFQPLFQFLSPEDVNNLSAQIIAVFQGEGATVESLISSTASLTSTLAEKDEVIRELIVNLESVLTTVNDRSDHLDTTLVTLDELVTGLAHDRETIGSTIEGMGGLTDSVAGLLEEGRDPLKKSIQGLGDLSQNLADGETDIDQFLETLPTKLDRIGRMASYGSWFNFYLCSIEGSIPMPEGYMGELGANNPAGRCR